MSINNAFNTLIGMQGREMTLRKADGSSSITLKAAISNYFRNLSGPEESVIEGREFVVKKEDLKVFGVPERGDSLTDGELGRNTIKEVRPMITLGGQIIGYRLRSA